MFGSHCERVCDVCVVLLSSSSLSDNQSQLTMTGEREMHSCKLLLSASVSCCCCCCCCCCAPFHLTLPTHMRRLIVARVLSKLLLSTLPFTAATTVSLTAAPMMMMIIESGRKCKNGDKWLTLGSLSRLSPIDNMIHQPCNAIPCMCVSIDQSFECTTEHPLQPPPRPPPLRLIAATTTTSTTTQLVDLLF